MSYADAQLDLSSVSVACLAGANGAGKSALLDATTWAIWEEARSSSDDLMRANEKHMWVDVRFTHEGQVYRIRRAREKRASRGGNKSISKGTLDFQVRDHLDTEWKSLTGASIKDTQRQICELLRMDYDTFINSAYLKQGQADEFTKKGPIDRKEVLGKILGLSYFDRLQEACKERIRSLKHKKDLLEQSLSRLPQIKEQLDFLSVARSEKGTRLEQIDADKSKWEDLAARLKEKLQNLALVKHKLETGERQLGQLQEDIRSLNEQTSNLKERLSGLTKLIADQATIEKEATEYQTIRSKIVHLDQSALRLQELTRSKVEARSGLSDLRNRLELEHNQAREKLAQLESKKNKLIKDTSDSAVIAQSFAEYRELVAKEASLAKKQETFVQIGNRCAELQARIDEIRIRLEVDLDQKTASLAEVDSVLNSKPLLDQQQLALQNEGLELDKLEEELEFTGERGQEIKSQIETIQAKIEHSRRTRKENQSKIAELSCSADSSICPLCAAPIVDRAAVIDRYQQQIEQVDREIVDLAHKASDKEKERSELRHQYKALNERLKQRKQLDNQIGQFNEKLSALRRAEETKDRLEGEVSTLKQRLSEGDYAQVERESLIALKEQQRELDFDSVYYNNLQSMIRTQRSIEARHYQLEKDLLELNQLAKEIPSVAERVSQLEANLAEESYGSEFRGVLTAVDHEINNLNYDSSTHTTLKARLEDLLPFIDRQNDLNRALGERPNLEQSVSSMQAALISKTKQLDLLKVDLDTWQGQLGELPEIVAEHERVEPIAAKSTLEYNQLATEIAVLDAQQGQLKTDLADLKSQEKALREMETSLKDYAFLSEAFGKKGIQAVIIENAIPEIEVDANRILSRLSDNKMHIGLTTQETNKSGNVVETLDILIGDETSTRSYELYSGGEAFKVNFAVRVALSRLLARRAGAKLETLIIDEGFGSQDDQSRDRLVKAIRSIQDDFARILVITHFSDVKEMFPTHILVSKQNGTSKVEIFS
jgi:exonuclease SbcC